MKKWLLLLLGIHLFLLVNLRFEAWPEMIVYPWLMNKGFLLYKDIINPYLPILPVSLFFFFKVFGFSIVNLKILTWGIILLIDILIFWISLKFWKHKLTAFLSLAFFIFWQPFLEGNSLWFDLAAVPFLLLGFFYFSQYFEKPKNYFSLIKTAIFLSLAFFIKQTVIYFYFLAIFLILLKGKKIKEAIGIIMAPLFFLFFICFFYFGFKGAEADFLFWSLKFPFFVMPFLPGHADYPILKEVLIASFPFLPLLLILFEPACLQAGPVKNTFDKFSLCFSTRPGVTPGLARRITIYSYYLTFSWFIISFLFVLPRWGLFHLQPALAFFSIITGKILFERFKKKKAAILLYFAIGLIIQTRFYKNLWQKQVRFFEPENTKLAERIKRETKDEDKIFLLNLQPQFYFLLNKIPPKPWADNFPWYLEYPGLQEKIIKSIKNEGIKSIIFSQYLEGEEYDLGVYRPAKIDNFIRKNFQKKFEIGNNVWLLEKKQ